MKEFTVPESEPAPQRRNEQPRPRKFVMPDSMGAPRSLEKLVKERFTREPYKR